MFNYVRILFICMFLVLLIPTGFYKLIAMCILNKLFNYHISLGDVYESDSLSHMIFETKKYPVKKCKCIDCNIEEEMGLMALKKAIQDGEEPFYIHSPGFKKLGKKWNLGYLKKIMNDDKVKITLTKNSVLNYFFAEGMKEKEMTWNEFIRRKKSWYETSVYYNAQNELPVQLKKEIENDDNIGNFYRTFNHQYKNKGASNLNSHFRTENLVYWFGFNGYFTPLHYDHEDGLLCCLHGYKDVWLFDPTGTNRIGGSDIFVYSNVFNIQQRYDLPGRYHIKLRPGDVLYIPQGWWHHVESIPEKEITDSSPDKTFYHLAVTFWLYPWNKEYSFQEQLNKIGEKQGKKFRERIKVKDLSEADKKRLELTGLWKRSDGNTKEIENPLFTDKYD